MNHISRYRILYIQAIVAIASAVVGELTGMKDIPRDQLAKLTWIFWTVMIGNIVINGGNVIIASLHPPPAAKLPSPNP